MANLGGSERHDAKTRTCWGWLGRARWFGGKRPNGGHKGQIRVKGSKVQPCPPALYTCAITAFSSRSTLLGKNEGIPGAGKEREKGVIIWSIGKKRKLKVCGGSASRRGKTKGDRQWTPPLAALWGLKGKCFVG